MVAGSPTPQQEAASWFVRTFGDLEPDEMDRLVSRYWTEYRRLPELVGAGHLRTDSRELRMLDIGGGYSTGLRLFPGTPFRWVLDTCVDELFKTSLPMPGEIRFLQGAGERIPFPDAFMDVVLCTNVLDHVRDPRRVVAETRRVLRPDGVFVLMVDIFETGAEHGEHDVLHPHTFHADAVETLLRDRFDVVMRTTQPTAGKVGLGMLARKQIVPHPDRQEHIWVLQPRRR